MFNRRCIPKSQRRERERVSELSLINQKRRERAIKDRKRSPSVDRTKRGRTRQQDKSPLFKKLPLELRLKIYEAALGESGPINVGFAEERYDQMALTSTACLEPENAGMPFCSCKPKNKQHRLKLLLTCKRMYAVTLMYSAFLFGADQMSVTARRSMFFTPATPSHLATQKHSCFSRKPFSPSASTRSGISALRIFQVIADSRTSGGIFISTTRARKTLLMHYSPCQG